VKALRVRRAPGAGVAGSAGAALAMALLMSAPALGQTAGETQSSPAAQPAAKKNKAPNIKELQDEIRRRDALIENLVRRVDRLEHEVSRGATRPRTTRTAVEPAVARPTTAGGPALAAAEVAQGGEETPPPPPPAPPPVPSAAPPPQPGTTSAPAPGQFEVSPEAAERALERTLVATGNLLVPEGFAEAEPFFSYTRRETPSLVLFNVNRNELAPGLDMRLGLPWESQLEVSLPWNFEEQQQTDIAVSPPQNVSDRWGNAVGDLMIGAAKQFVHENGWIPGILGRVTWEAPTGPLTANGVPLTSGEDKLGVSLTALRRQDPLVFVFTGGYTKAFQANQINPGNEWNFLTGAFLATSPETTLFGTLSQNFIQDVKVNGVTVPGSNTVQPILSLGASSILGRGVLMDLQVGFGLTNSAPKYTVLLSSTYRFGVTGH
jgi:hypothetical protein